MSKVRKIAEKIYPYILALAVVVLLYKMKIDFISSKKMDEALNAIITTTSIIIGFIGAILPVIMSMKNDSKIVTFVFQKDADKLFLKYIKQTVATGIILILITIFIFFRDQYVKAWIYSYVFDILTFFLIAFLLCTYRSLKYILELIFMKDTDLDIPDEIFSKKSAQEEAFERALAERQKK